MALNTEELRDYFENEYPIDVVGIYISRSGVRIQYREQFGDENVDRQLRKAQLKETADSFMKKAAYMDANLDRDSKMMMQLGSGSVDTVIQRVATKISNSTPDEYRIRQDIIRNTNEQYIFSTKFYPLDCKEAVDITTQTLREHVTSETEKKYILELQHRNATDRYTAIARFHTGDSYSTIMGLETQG
ncbi:MAG: hypothetical protein ACR2PU_01100 [Gammaproteobacteria bacterium]